MHIGDWLRELDLPEYEPVFRANAIELDVLAELTEADLEKLGVLLGHRKRMLRAITALGGLAPGTLPRHAPMEPEAVPAEAAQRRQLTVMFCDLVGSTPLATRLDSEDLRDVLATYHKIVTAIVESFDGFVARYIGDGVLVYFGYPRAHEEAAERAVRASLAIIGAMPRLESDGEQVQVRIGIATGLVVMGELSDGGGSEHEIVGETPNLTARLQTLADPGTLLIDQSTRRLVGELFEYRDLGRIRIKGFAQPTQVWRVMRPGMIASRFEALRAASTTPLVGRDDEIELLFRSWQRAGTGEGWVVLISGEPGMRTGLTGT